MIEAFSLLGRIALRGGTDVDRQLRDVGDTAERTGGRLGGLGKAVGGLGATFAGAGLLQGLAGLAGGFLQTAADLQAMKGQYEQVMGAMKGESDKYIDSMAKKWGKHPNQLKSAMMQYYAILKGKGLSEEEAYQTAQKYMDMTVDGNAFANEDMESTVARTMGIIKGEYDSADTMMVNLSQNMLNDMAQEKYKKKWDELTAAQQENIKTMEAIRQQQSAGVTGQGEREAGSYANAIARLNETWKEFQESVAGPFLEQFAGYFDKITLALQGVSNWFKNLTKDQRDYIIVGGFITAALIGVTLAIGGVVLGLYAMAAAAGITAGAMSAALLGIPILIAAIVAGVIWMVKNWDKVRETAQYVWQWISDSWNTWFRPILDGLSKFMTGGNSLMDNWNLIKQAAKWLKDTVVGAFNAILKAWDKIKNLDPSKLVGKAKGAIGNVGGKISGAWSGIKTKLFAKGGYFDNGPTLFGAGEAGKEVMMPIEHRRNMQPFAKAVAENLNVSATDSNAGRYEIPVYIGDKEIVRAIIPRLDVEMARRQARQGSLLNRGNL